MMNLLASERGSVDKFLPRVRLFGQGGRLESHFFLFLCLRLSCCFTASRGLARGEGEGVGWGWGVGNPVHV